MAIKLNEKIKQQMNGWKDENGEIKLPFDAPVFWVLNGSAQWKPLAKESPALYFGGWACAADELEKFGNIPSGLVQHEFMPQDADEPIRVYSARHLMIAPFGKRLSSVEKITGTRFPGYHKGASPQLQMLCLIAERNENKTITPVYPAMLTVHGFQVGYVLDALKTWDTKTQPARKQFADGLKANAFWCCVGTFGDKFISKLVGSSKQSPITPMAMYVPDVIDEKLIDTLFVGEAIAEQMNDLREQSADWLAAWKTEKAESSVVSGEPQPIAPVEYADENEQEFPF